MCGHLGSLQLLLRKVVDQLAGLLVPDFMDKSRTLIFWRSSNGHPTCRGHPKQELTKTIPGFIAQSSWCASGGAGPARKQADQQPTRDSYGCVCRKCTKTGIATARTGVRGTTISLDVTYVA